MDAISPTVCSNEVSELTQQALQSTKPNPSTLTLTEPEKQGLKELSDGSIMDELLSRMMKEFHLEGNPYLTKNVFQALRETFHQEQQAKTPFERLLIQQIIICHCRSILLQIQVDWQAGSREQNRFLELANREVNKMRRLMLTYQQLNNGKNFTVIHTSQANISHGPQQINNNPNEID